MAPGVNVFKRDKSNLIVDNDVSIKYTKLCVDLYKYYAKGVEKYENGIFSGFNSETNQNKKENSVIFYEDDYVDQYDGFDPNNPESVIGLTLMQEEYLDQSIIAASYIQNSFVQNLKRKNRNVKQAGFIVLKYTYMPSVLIETGFLTNKSEGSYLNSLNGQKEMSNAISKAIIKY